MMADTRCSKNSGLVDLILKCPVIGDRHAHPADRLPFRHPRQHRLGNLRQQGARQDVIHIARSAFDFGAAAGDGADQRLVVQELGAMIFRMRRSILPSFTE